MYLKIENYNAFGDSKYLKMHWIIFFNFLLLLDVATSQLPPELSGAGSSGGAVSSGSTTNFFSTRRIRNSNIIRFDRAAYVGYEFTSYVTLYPEMFYQARNESLSFQFITNEANGLIWMDNGPDRVMYLAIKNIEQGKLCDGYLLFVIVYRDRAALQFLLRHQDLGDLNNFRWHTFKVQRFGRQLTFFIDQIMVRQVTLDFDIQFVITGGNVYLGGSPDTNGLTDGVISLGYDGALTDVIYEKWTSTTRIIYISLLTYIGSTHGNVTIIEPGRPVTPYPTTQRPQTPRTWWPPTTYIPPTRPTRPTIRVVTVITTISIIQRGHNIHIPGHLDLRSGGIIKFRFRTLEYRGLIFYTQRDVSDARFIACEIFDGKLYFVYNFGGGAQRIQISDTVVNTGEWQEIKMEFTQREVIFYLNGQPQRIPITSQERLSMYLDDGIYIGGVRDTVKLSWHLWNRHGDFVGCFGDLHAQFHIAGIQNGCVTLTKQCPSRPCIHGACYDSLIDYRCYCAGTGFTGDKCNQVAVIGGFQGNHYVTYYYSTTQITHTNDISVRFISPLSRAFLFQTFTDRDGGFIRAELVDGRVKVTIHLDGRTQEFYTGSNLNINEWHTLNIRRRANQLQLWMNKERPKRHNIRGENFYIYIDRINFGSVTDTGATIDGVGPNYIGYLQNIYFNDIDLFAELRRIPPSQINIIWIENEGQYGDLIYNPVTFMSHNVYSQLTPLRIGLTMRLTFKFKTKDLDGVLLFNKGTGGKFIGIELVDGYLRFAFNNGYKNSVTLLNKGSKLNDNQWHTFEVREIREGSSRYYEIRVDGARNSKRIPVVGSGTLDLIGPLYIGGLSEAMFSDQTVSNFLLSKQGFLGCMASVDLNGATPNLQLFASTPSLMSSGCVDIKGVCETPSPCFHDGICTPGLSTFVCDCKMTGWSGLLCNQYPNGLYFYKNGQMGILKYQLENLVDFQQDNIALAFMTYAEDGLLMRLDSGISSEFIEIYLEMELKQSDLIIKNLTMANITFLSLYVKEEVACLLLMDMKLHASIKYVYIGGFQDSSGSIMNAYNGIIGGTYWNEYGFVDLAYKTDSFIYIEGAGHVNPGGLGGTGPAGGAPDQVGIGGPGDLSGGGGTVLGPGGGGAAGTAARLTAAGGGPGPVSSVSGARAGAVAGTILGTGAFLASLMWALYKFKPGTGMFGAGKPPAGPSATPLTISPPSPTGAGAGAGSGAGATKVTVLNGSAGAGTDVVEGGGGGGSTGYSAFYSSSTATASGGGGAAGYDSATLRATGTFSNKGTSIGTPTATRAFLGSGGVNSSSYSYSDQKSSYGTSGRSGDFDTNEGDYDMANGIVATTGSGGAGGAGATSSKGYSSSTMTSSYSYQVQNVRTVKQNRDSVHQMVSYSGVSSGAVTPGAAGDEVRVDCCLMGADGRSVVTGSTLGPPQVWDMQTGELLRIMKGDTVGSTNLHLASNDRLLVGAVHADLEINEFSTRKGVTNKRLQIWDFTTGRPLDMGTEETCSALCTMSNPEKIVFGRSEKYGNGTSIIIWDLLGNQAIKEMFYDAPEITIIYNIIEPNTLRLDANTDCTVILPRDEAVTGLRNGDLVVWSLRTGQPSRQLLSSSGGHAHNKEVKAVALSDDSKYLVSASADRTLKIWDMQSERQINTLVGHTDEIQII
ncbi:LOW QUALITY PROTEIN: hypothetical protein KUTeg_001496 [Tegillarca granosa]|uniref:Neurexin-1 n=1 Tax=Tegillarca granosa TaxID=220873 RepID=A0ABQ9FRL4_TEGGR|nr:LOW QUALITY PROTEIN: hypothetical protein KUTeg_001496 [Tegillarca granosa]